MLRIFLLNEKYDIFKIFAIFMILITVIFIFVKKLKKSLLKNFYFKAIVAIILIASIPTFVTGTLIYGQDPIEVLRRTQNYYAYFVFVILFCWIGNNALVVKNLNLAIVSLSVTLCCLFIFCAINPNIGRVILINEAYLPDRFGLQRLTTLSATTPFILYSTIYLFFYLTHGRGKKIVLAFVSFLIMVFFLIFVSLSRSTIIAMFILTTIYVLTKMPLRNKLIFLYVTGFILFISELIFTNSLIDLLFNSYTTLLEESKNVEGTTGIRLEGIQYLLNEFASTGGIGFGLVSSERTQSNVLSEGFKLGYNPADMGIIGVFLIYGFPAILLTIVICKKIIMDIRNSNRFVRDEDISIIQKSLAGYLVFCIMTLSQLFFWDQFSLFWGIFFYMVWACSELRKFTDQGNGQTTTICNKWTA